MNENENENEKEKEALIQLCMLFRQSLKNNMNMKSTIQCIWKNTSFQDFFSGYRITVQEEDLHGKRSEISLQISLPHLICNFEVALDSRNPIVIDKMWKGNKYLIQGIRSLSFEHSRRMLYKVLDCRQWFVIKEYLAAIKDMKLLQKVLEDRLTLNRDVITVFQISVVEERIIALRNESYHEPPTKKVCLDSNEFIFFQPSEHSEVECYTRTLVMPEPIPPIPSCASPSYDSFSPRFLQFLKRINFEVNSNSHSQCNSRKTV